MFVLFFMSLLFAGNHGNGIIIRKDLYPKISHQWNVIPKIIICNDSPFNYITVQKAANIWREEGLQIGNIIYESDSNKCDEGGGKINYKRGYIQIRGYRGTFPKYEYLGYTMYFYDKKNKNITYGKIIEFSSEYDISNKDLKLLVHELGHALGYSHYDEKYDIMNR